MVRQHPKAHTVTTVGAKPRLLVFPKPGEDVRSGTIGVDLDRLLVSRMLVQASSGGGKSWLARYVVEQTHGRIQQIIVDSEGEFASLRERYGFVLASAGFRIRGTGDLPAEPESASALCRGLFELGLSAVLDVSDLPKSGRRRFVRLFIEALMDLPQEMWRPLLFVLDEAQDYAPERGSGRDIESLEAVVALCSQGRKRGFCPVLLTQRLSKLHKDAAAELLNVFVGLTQLDVDVNRAADTLGFGKELRETLRMLEPGNGEMYAYGPALSERGVVLVKSGRVETSHPEPGKVSTQAPPPPKEMAGMLTKLSETLKDAAPDDDQELASGPGFRCKVDQEVNRRVAELVSEAVRRAEEPLKEYIASLETTLASARKQALVLASDLAAGLDTEPTSMTLPAQGPQEYRKPSATTAPRQAITRQRNIPTRANEPRLAKAVLAEEAELPGARRRILATLLSMETLGISGLGHKNLAVFSGQGPRSSAYSAHLAALRKEGYVEYPEPGRASLTTMGRAVALGLEEEGTNEPLRWERPRSLQSLHAAWFAHLPDAQSRLLSVLIERYPAEVSHDELARLAAQSPNSSAYAAHRAALKHLGLIEYPRPGQARATKLLFPEGLV